MNIFETNDVATTRYVVLDDRTGDVVDVSQRVDILKAVEHIQDVYAKVLASKPSVEQYETLMAMRELCRHFGWSPVEIALVEQYQAQNGAHYESLKQR